MLTDVRNRAHQERPGYDVRYAVPKEWIFVLCTLTRVAGTLPVLVILALIKRLSCDGVIHLQLHPGRGPLIIAPWREVRLLEPTPVPSFFIGAFFETAKDFHCTTYADFYHPS